MFGFSLYRDRPRRRRGSDVMIEKLSDKAAQEYIKIQEGHIWAKDQQIKALKQSLALYADLEEEGLQAAPKEPSGVASEGDWADMAADMAPMLLEMFGLDPSSAWGKQGMRAMKNAMKTHRPEINEAFGTLINRGVAKLADEGKLKVLGK